MCIGLERVETMLLHPDDTALWKQCEAYAWNVAKLCDIPLLVVEPKRRPMLGGAEGLCYRGELRVSVVIRFGRKQNHCMRWHSKPLPAERIQETIRHELAHILANGCHGPEFKAELERIETAVLEEGE